MLDPIYRGSSTGLAAFGTTPDFRYRLSPAHGTAINRGNCADAMTYFNDEMNQPMGAVAEWSANLDKNYADFDQ